MQRAGRRKAEWQEKGQDPGIKQSRLIYSDQTKSSLSGADTPRSALCRPHSHPPFIQKARIFIVAAPVKRKEKLSCDSSCPLFWTKMPTPSENNRGVKILKTGTTQTHAESHRGPQESRGSQWQLNNSGVEMHDWCGTFHFHTFKRSLLAPAANRPSALRSSKLGSDLAFPVRLPGTRVALCSWRGQRRWWLRLHTCVCSAPQ